LEGKEDERKGLGSSEISKRRGGKADWASGSNL